MSKKEKNDWEDLNELFLQVGEKLNVLEEEIDILIQKEYFDLLSQLTHVPAKFKTIGKKYQENINDLFNEDVEEDVKKKMLVTLATIEDITVYRAIESFSKQENSLKKWAIIALQQSRMLIESTILEDSRIFISTGLGGKDFLLRYFCVFINKNDEILQEFQQRIVVNETESALKALGGCIEQVDFKKGYSSLLLLLPLNADIKILFEGIVDECNTFGNFLHMNMIITNVKKLSENEIQELLKRG